MGLLATVRNVDDALLTHVENPKLSVQQVFEKLKVRQIFGRQQRYRVDLLQYSQRGPAHAPNLLQREEGLWDDLIVFDRGLNGVRI